MYYMCVPHVLNHAIAIINFNMFKQFLPYSNMNYYYLCKVRNVELVAMWPGPKKPSAKGMNLLFTPIVDEFQQAYEG